MFRHQFLTLLTTLLLIVVTGYLYVKIPKGFFPQQDTGFIFGEVDTRQDASFAATTALRHDDRRYRSARTRRSTACSRSGRRLFIQPDGKHRPRLHSIGAVRPTGCLRRSGYPRLRPEVAQVGGAKFFMQAGQDIKIGGRLSRYSIPIHADRHRPRRTQSLGSNSRAGDAKAAGTAGCGVRSAGRRSAYLDHRRSRRCITLGLSANVIDQTLYDAFGQRQVAAIYTSTNQYRVVLEVAPQFRKDPTHCRKSMCRRPRARRCR